MSNGFMFSNSSNASHRACFACKDHPAARDRLDFLRRQKDVTRAQEQDFRNTGDGGGDNSEGYSSSSSEAVVLLQASGWVTVATAINVENEILTLPSAIQKEEAVVAPDTIPFGGSRSSNSGGLRDY